MSAITKESIKKIFRDWTNPGLPNEKQSLGEYIDREYEKGPMRETKPDPALLEKVRKLLRPNETTLNQFVSRVGCSPDQIRRWPLEKIAEFVILADQRVKDEVPEPRRPRSEPAWKAKKEEPIRFAMTD